MAKYVVIGGFLGAGKTTSMLAFSEEIKKRDLTPGLLINDLGSRNLVDGAFSAASGVAQSEVTGGCICYQTENLVDKLRRLRDREHADLILSDIPGCGIGGLDHVYHTLAREYPGEFELCPFTAVVDPERLRALMPEHAELHLPPEMLYLFDAQLREAELVLLNKTDLLTPEETERDLSFLRENYPHARVLGMSARTGAGVAEAVDVLLAERSALPTPDIGCGGPEFLAAEQRLSWYNRQFQIVGDKPFDGNAFVEDLMETVRGRLRRAGRNIPHLKVLASTPDWQSVKASFLGIDYPVEYDWRLDAPQTDLRVVVNARAACESDRLDALMDEAMRETVGRFGTRCQVFFTECFGMMDEGRL